MLVSGYTRTRQITILATFWGFPFKAAGNTTGSPGEHNVPKHLKQVKRYSPLHEYILYILYYTILYMYTIWYICCSTYDSYKMFLFLTMLIKTMSNNAGKIE